MARYTDSVCRQCRREGTKLFLKGDRCYSDKCAVTKRHTPPGMHGQGRRKQSEYGIQLREKQKAKRYYGILENQFRMYFEQADKREGVTGENLLTTIERRLDNVAYRAGFGASRREARQLVRHGHFSVNGKKANIPSIILKVGDVIALRERSKDAARFKEVAAELEAASATLPKWLTVNVNDLSITVNALPQRDDIDFEIEEQLIVELYSK